MPINSRYGHIWYVLEECLANIFASVSGLFATGDSYDRLIIVCFKT